MSRRQGRRNMRALLLGALLFLIAATSDAMPAPGDQEIADPTVSGNTGAATYRIPIDVPPGPRGFQPNLALVYSSHAGDGPFGIGWNLNILSEIRCTARFGVPDYSACPRYELDSQLLTYNAAEQRYHPFVETFQRIKKLTNHWEVTSTDGTIRRYGSTDDSKIHVEGTSGDVARWLLAEIEDTFGNKIEIKYLRDDGGTPAIPFVGTAYPKLITYAGGERKVKLLYEDRPDPIRDFTGGVDRKVTKRLREISIESGSSTTYLFRRHLFGYDSLDGETFLTERSRLLWAQIFGNDCTDDDPVAECTGLPPMRFDYTDPDDDLEAGVPNFGDTSSFTYTALPSNVNNVEPLPNLYADVNGDGLVDRIDVRGNQNYDIGQTSMVGQVRLNNGADWIPDTAWTEAMGDITITMPRITYSTVIPQSSGYLPICSASLTVGGNPDVVSDGLGLASYEQKWPHALHFIHPSGTDGDIVPRPRIHLTDIDSDGYADVVISVHLSGILVTHDCSGAPLAEPTYEGGVTTSVVFRNTGDPSTGWELDPSLALGLPPFGEVALASEHVIGTNYEWLHNSGISTCERTFLKNPYNDICWNTINFEPRFVDLNGDGYLDLMALEREDPSSTAVMVGMRDHFRVMDGDSDLRSRAWIQDPTAGPGEPRWVADERFDLPIRNIYGADDTDPTKPGTTAANWNHARVLMTNFLASAVVQTDQYPMIHTLDSGVRFVDVNRDGLTDVVWSIDEGTEPDRGVLINRGRGAAGTATVWCASDEDLFNPSWTAENTCAWSADYLPPSWSIAQEEPTYASAGVGYYLELNGDGLLDFLYFDRTRPPLSPIENVEAWLGSPGENGTKWVRDDRFTHFAHDEGCIFISEPLCNPPGFTSNFQPMDLNGDGVTDMAGSSAARISDSHHQDLLATIHNGQGGTVRIEYASDIQQRVPALETAAATHAHDPEGDGHGPEGEPDGEAEPLGPDPNLAATVGHARWTTRPLVSEMTISGYGFDPIVTTYRYADPRWCHDHRSSLGFRLVEAQRADGSTVERYHWQKHGRAGRLAKTLVRDGGDDLFVENNDWEIPLGAITGSIVDPEVFVGRLAYSYRANLYAGSPGAELERTLTYDDSYGFNFAKQIDVDRPTGLLSTVLTPEDHSPGDWISGLVADRKEKNAVGDEISHSAFTFTSEGAVNSRTDYRKDRGASGTGEALETTFAYDPKGNVREITGPGINPRVTSFCYDGSPSEYHASCTAFAGPLSSGVQTGVVDPLGNLTSSKPDPASGLVVEVSSYYHDEPKVTFGLDAYSRVVTEWITPQGGTATKTRDIIYHNAVEVDPKSPASQEELVYTGNGDDIRTATVFNGFGGTWKQIGEAYPDPQNPNTPSFFGTLRYQKPSSSEQRQTYPINCGADAFCSGLNGDTQSPATVTTLDALGRPESVTTPDGISRFAYSGGTRQQQAGPATTDAFDVVLASNGKGDLVERWLDGDRVAWVHECHGGVAPGESLSGKTCGASDDTFYTYDADGSISTIFDAAATSGDDYDDPDHYLRYHYDTLARVRQIEDPDGGTSTTDYDVYGNVATTVNGRGQAAIHGYDGLDRPLAITPLVNGTPVQFTYRTNEKQREKEVTSSYELEFSYDSLGRVGQKSHKALGGNGFTLLLDFAYDLTDRVTQIVYPDDSTAVNYEYERAYLKRVCEVDDPAHDCGHQDADFFISDVDYDSLGRRQLVAMPPGDRSYQYLGDNRRLKEDRFDAVQASGYWIQRDYGIDTTGHDAYDEIGNIIDVRGGSSESGDPVVAATYTYDRRNRIASWTRSGSTEHFGYDELGNLTGYATGSAGGSNQVFGESSGARPHAVTSSSASGSSVTYGYDDDGNMATATDSSATTHYTFDWASRMVKVGDTAGGSSILGVTYDASGSRMSDLRGLLQRVYVDEHMTLTRADVWSSTFDSSEFHIYAFGEMVGYKFSDTVTLRTAEAAWLQGLPRTPPWVLAALLAAASAVLLWRALALGLAGPVMERPAIATATWALALLVALPPLPAGGGGGGGTTARRWLVTDRLGSGVVWLDEQGLRQRHTEFAPFGKVDAQHVEVGIAPPQVYAGHRREHATGLDYMQARWCNAATGSFLSVDPYVADVNDPQSFNAYAYARNNPMSLVDPTGELPAPPEPPPEPPPDLPESFAIESEMAADRAMDPLTPFTPEQPGFEPQGPDGPAAGEGPQVAAVILAPFLPTLGTFLVGTGVAILGGYTGHEVVSVGIEILQQSDDGSKDNPETETSAQEPGEPTKADGFKPKKNWDGKKVRAPNGGFGYPDRKGNVWVPTGPKPSRAHGGPHWDVQHPDGGHTNVYPGGGTR